ncbi:MAG: MGMT family protein [Candidatus Aenigmarchaeota archaeon]|nr:MGMT family protein [Candidatus Aenigmarchaeota archaeon]
MKRFDDRVLELTARIPEGKVATYRDLARALHTTAYRAVGQALRRNEHPIEIPCHRVVRSDGRVGGYAGKQESAKKVALLRGEGIPIRKGRIDLARYGHRF